MRPALSILFFVLLLAQTTLGNDNLRAEFKEILEENPQAAQAYLLTIEDQLIEKDSSRLLGALYFALAEKYELNLFKYDSAVSFYNKARDYYAQSGSTEFVARSIQNKGLALLSAGDFNSAITSFKEARVLFEEAAILDMFLGMDNNIGQAFSYSGQFDSAKFYFLKVLLSCDSVPGQHCLNAQTNLGIVHMNMGEPAMAEKNYKEVLPGYIALKDTLQIANVYNNLAGTHWARSQFDSCIYYLELAEEMYEATGNLGALNFCYVNLGALNADIGNYQEGLYYSTKAIDVSKRVNSTDNLINAYINAAKPAYYINDKSAGYAYLDSAVAIAEADKLLFHLTNIYKSRKELSLLISDFESAFQAQSLQHAYKDSLSSQENQKAIAELQTKYETEQKEQQIALQEAQIAEQQAQLQLNLIFIIALIVVVVLVVAVALLNKSRAKKQQELLLRAAELQLKEAQIESAIASQEQERKRFARDLHDGFGQFISVLNLNLKSLEKGADNREEVFENSATVLDQMYRELKTICFNLMPETLIKQGVVNGIREFSDRIRTTGKIAIEVDTFGMEDRLADLHEISIYRITQEWVNNIIKYSDATKINIQLTRDESEITLLIEDDGTGFDQSLLTNGKGNGWRNLNSRANLIKGELELDTSPGIKGNTLILNVPIRMATHVPA